MTVFKGYMKITKQNLGILFMYLAIFMGITIGMQNAYKEDNISDFSAVKLDIALVNEDGGTLSQVFAEQLKQFHNVTDMDNDESSLLEAMFYENIDYIVRIPQQFERVVIKEGGQISVTKKPGSFDSFYGDQQINNILNTMRVYNAAGYSPAQMKDAMQGGEQVKVTLIDLNGNDGVAPAYSNMFRFLPYLLLAVLCYIMSLILASFKKRDVNNRMRASAISVRRQTMESLLAFLTVGISIWSLCILISIALYGKEFLQDQLLGYYLLNSFILMLVSLAIAFLVGTIIQGATAINGAVNVISLGMCFLCGAFVPIEILGNNVKKVSQFLPVYWYEIINENLGEYITLSPDVKSLVWKGFGIQILFAAACVCVGMVINKYKQQDRT